ncbi:hypothetical protein N2152v2_004654 [Parachlorella kessleri]
MRLLAAAPTRARTNLLGLGTRYSGRTVSPRPQTLAPAGRPAKARDTSSSAKKNEDGGKVIPREFFDLAETVAANLSGRPPSPPPQRQKPLGSTGNGVYSLLLINFGLFAIGQAAFLHANWAHLSSNAFSLLIFGRIVEEEEGAFGVWATYLLCGLGGCVASYLTSPHTRTVSLGASAAVFGLFMVGVLTKFRPSLRRLLEAIILGQFVIRQVASEVQLVAGGRALTVGGMQVGHIAHLAGAAVGALLVLLLSKLPDVGSD